MNLFLQELWRWQQLPGFEQIADRWTRWAQFLSERYERMICRAGEPAMTVVQITGPGPGSVAWTINPRIHLSIHPVLQSISGNDSRNMVGRLSDPHLSAEVENFSGVPNIGSTPMSRVFARTGGGETSQAGNILRLVPVQNSRQILRRVVNERKRIEEREPQITGTHQRPEPTTSLSIERGRVFQRYLDGRGAEERGTEQYLESPLIRRAEILPEIEVDRSSMKSRRMIYRQPDSRKAEGTATEEILESPPGRRVGISGMAQTGVDKEFELERLTEQVVRKIDERIIAHRERMGRLF